MIKTTTKVTHRTLMDKPNIKAILRTTTISATTKEKKVKAWVHISLIALKPIEIFFQKNKPKCDSRFWPAPECMYPCTISYKITTPKK